MTAAVPAESEISSPTDEILGRLKKSIFELPLPILTDEIRKEIDLEHGATAAALARLEMDKAITLLNNECCLGNEDAVRVLATLALRINTILIQFVGDPTKMADGGGAESDPTSATEPATAEQEAEISKTIRTIRNHPPDSIRRWLAREKNSNDAIYVPAKLAHLKGETSDPPMIDDVVADETDFENTLTEVLQHVVGQRLFMESRMAARQVAGESLVWPVSIPAISEKRDELYEGYISKLPIGESLPFRVGRKIPGKRGRSFKQGSSTAFTEAVFRELTIERKIFLSTIPQKQKNALNSFTTGEPVQVEPKSPPAWMPPISGSMTNVASGMQDLAWRKKVEMLKPLQSSNVDLWVEAGATFCEDECAGNWEEYRLIRCIGDRAKTKPDQSLEACVTEILRTGAIKLSKRNE